MRPFVQVEHERHHLGDPMPDIYPGDVNFAQLIAADPSTEITSEKSSQLSGPETILSAGEIAVGLAMSTSENTEEALIWLQHAKQNFEEVAELTDSSTKKPILSFLGAKALLLGAQLPNHVDMITSGKLPSPLVAGLAYVRSVEVALQLKAGRAGSIKEADALRRLGLLAKTDVLLLGQRYALSEHRDQSWFPIWSLPDEVQDVTVFTDMGEGISTGYKIKVKSSEHAAARDTEGYPNDVTVVCLDPHLAWRGGERMVAKHITKDLEAERLGDEAATGRLDRRTKMLLDILG